MWEESQTDGELENLEDHSFYDNMYIPEYLRKAFIRISGTAALGRFLRNSAQRLHRRACLRSGHRIYE